MPAIEVITGASEGTDVSFDGECHIGSGDNATLKLGDKGISRKHARVYKDGGGFKIADLGSANGTYVNFRRLKKEEVADLSDKDVVFCGKTVLKFYAGDIPPRGKGSGGGGGGDGVISESELLDLLRGSVPIRMLAAHKKELGELGKSLALRAERAEVMRRLGLHKLSQDQLDALFTKARN